MSATNKQTLERLQRLRDELPHCLLVSFVDLSVEMTLAASLRSKLPQEKLDEICRLAIDALSAPGTQASVAALPGRIVVIVRASQADGEALCCVIAPQGDAAQAKEMAGKCLVDLMQEEPGLV